ncbi:nitrogenase component 1 [Pelosinus sp. IPA-1]|uniref:nitrogenase component 1 n=1 Tax=Pelosinus sp. IPA-1 TaxID=3029569 RepID=UPI0024362AB4|nr:nitrogenase component 1 [Pelosinus sp. IPA-1]GMB00677.1 oxidoreductase nitrogenase component 1 [Pelosinus sp. IPA-1]
MSNFIERPRFTCALGGAMATVTALPKGVPILHAPSGCAGNHAWTQAGGCGLQVGGYCGGLSIPGSNVQEKEVVFGGTERLEEQINNTLKVMDGDLYVVLTSCVTDIIGDDVASVVRPLRDKGIDIIHAETGGFKGNSYLGYELVLESLLGTYISKGKTKKGSVNVWGIAPYFDVFWRGNLEGIRNLLRKLDLEVNTFFTIDDSLAGIQQAGSAELNIVVSSVIGEKTAEISREIHGIPYLMTDLPIGPAASDEFLRTVGSALHLDQEFVEKVIVQENLRYYQLLEPMTDCFNDMDLQRYAAVIGDSNYAVSIARFLSEDLGWLPEVVAITDVLDEEKQSFIMARLTSLTSRVTPKIIFADNSTEIAGQVKEHWANQQGKGGKYNNPLTPAFVVGSSLDRPLATDLGAAHLSVSFPVANRAVIDRGYTGYHGGLRLIEDLISTMIINR